MGNLNQSGTKPRSCERYYITAVSLRTTIVIHKTITYAKKVHTGAVRSPCAHHILTQSNTAPASGAAWCCCSAELSTSWRFHSCCPFQPRRNSETMLEDVQCLWSNMLWYVAITRTGVQNTAESSVGRSRADYTFKHTGLSLPHPR